MKLGIAAVLCLLLLGGCATTYEGQFDPALFPRSVASVPENRVPGRVALLVPTDLQVTVVQIGRQMRLGAASIVERALLAALADDLQGGADLVDAVPPAGDRYQATLAVDAVPSGRHPARPRGRLALAAAVRTRPARLAGRRARQATEVVAVEPAAGTMHWCRIVRPLVTIVRIRLREGTSARAMTTARLAWRPLLLAALLASSPVARACGYHDPSSINLGMLNWSYPDALHVRTAVWMAQRDGALARADQPAESDPAMATIGAMLRLRETTLKLGTWRDRAGATLNGRPVPAFSIVLIGTMLWARFEQAGGKFEVTPHANGPASDDVVIVTDEPVISALLEGQITPQAARERGLVRLYGTPQNIQGIESLLDRMASTGTSAVPRHNPSNAQEES